MIKYALLCDAGHEFESWFPDSAGFDVQAKRGLVACPSCGSVRVGKAIMAPAIGRGLVEASPATAAAPAPAKAPAQPVALLDDKHAELRSMIRELREKITTEAQDVGDRFPEEARRMHDGVVPERPIYGQATLEDAKALLDEGIGILPLPRLPDEHN